MASYAPAFGMLGTVMGLIIMMASQADSSSAAVLGSSQSDDVMAKLLSGMGIALVTTFYGVLLSNLFFLPIAGKLKTLSEHEVRVDEIIIVGMLALQRQDSPLRMKDTLLNFVSERMRIQLEQQVMPSRPS
jgi:chemotaxis protein MotA